MKPPSIEPLFDILLHEERQLQHQPQSPIIAPIQPLWQQITILGRQSSVPRGGIDCRSGNDVGAPAGAEMVLGGVEDGDEDADDTLGFDAVGEGRAVGVGEEGAGEVADGGYDYGEVVAAVPETVVGGLVAEDLGGLVNDLRGLITSYVWR